jgi:hypothetical protein
MGAYLITKGLNENASAAKARWGHILNLRTQQIETFAKSPRMGR